MATDLTETLSPTRLRVLWAATIWPVIYMGLFMVVWLAGVFGMAGLAGLEGSGGAAGAGFVGTFFVVFAVVGVLHVLTMVLQFTLLAVYVWLVLEVDLDSNQRLLWGGLVVFTGPIGQVLFLSRVLGPAAEGQLAEA